jgi:hypothetical protein
MITESASGSLREELTPIHGVPGVLGVTGIVTPSEGKESAKSSSVSNGVGMIDSRVGDGGGGGIYRVCV